MDYIVLLFCCISASKGQPVDTCTASVNFVEIAIAITGNMEESGVPGENGIYITSMFHVTCKPLIKSIKGR